MANTQEEQVEALERIAVAFEDLVVILHEFLRIKKLSEGVWDEHND